MRPAAKEMDAGIAARLDEAIDKAMDQAGVPGAIIGIWGPDGDYVRAVGVADQAGGAQMSTDFYHRIGSQTKTFTVTGVLQLADQGKLGLDDPIAKYIDGVPEGDKITLRQLARMQSGLANYTDTDGFQQAFFADPFQNFTPQELLDFAFAEPMKFQPGEGFLYCNTNTVLLGLVVEKVSGQSLPDYIRDHITTPLGMSHTSFPTTNAFPDPHAQGYTTQDRRQFRNDGHRLEPLLGVGRRRDDLHPRGHAHLGARAGDRKAADTGDAGAAAADRHDSGHAGR